MEMCLGYTEEDTRMWDSLGETGTVAKDLARNARLLNDTDINDENEGDVDFESPDTAVETFERPSSLSKPSSTTSMAMLSRPTISVTMNTTSEATWNPGVRTDDDDMDIGYLSDYTDATLESLPGHIDMTTCLNSLRAFGTVNDTEAEFMEDDHGSEITDNSEDPAMPVCGKEVANREGITSASVLEEQFIRGTSSTTHPTCRRPSGIGADEDSATSTVGLLDPCITESISVSAEMDDGTTIQGFMSQLGSGISLVTYLWFLFPAFLSLYFIKLEYLIPTTAVVTLQGLFTAMTFCMPIWIIFGSAIATVLRTVTWPLWGLESLLLSAAVVLFFHNSISEAPPQRISDQLIYFITGDWSMTPQLCFTIFFMSVPVFVAAGQAVRHSLTHRHLSNISTYAAIDLTKSTGLRDSVISSGPSFQPGLGTLSCLPPEVRSGIWQQLFLHATPNLPECRPDIYELDCLANIEFDAEFRSELRKQRILPMLEAVQQSELLPDRQQDNLAILRTSKQLHGEVDGDFHRNRTITFCFDNNQHSLLLQRIGGKPTDYYITLGNICVARDFANTDFSKFTALHLDIELPSNHNPGVQGSKSPSGFARVRNFIILNDP
ncbi:MAG: hypothetical protein Q9171_001562 [Xanthocarpia ochracea]